MKARKSLAVMFVFVLLVLALAVGCSKRPNDAQIIGEVTQKIQADPNVATKTVGVQSNDGVVTLTGTVGSDMERIAAANAAGQVSGVRTVLNNLTVQQAEAAPLEEPVVEEPRPEPVKTSARQSVARPAVKRTRPQNDYAPPSEPVVHSPAPVAAAPAMPAPKPMPTTVTVPDGTQVSIRLIDGLDSEKSQIGDSFRATLNHSVMVGDRVAIPAGADVMGRVVDAKDAGRFAGRSALSIELVSVAMGGKSYELHTNEYRREGAARGKNTAAKVGGGAALGAIIGAIAGGGKGAAIGATVGAGAGTGVQAATKGQQVRLPSESVLNFQLMSPVTVTPGAVRNSRPMLSEREGDVE